MHTTHPESVASKAPDRPALVLAETGEMLTFSELARTANQTARVFQSLGLQPGDAIALFLRNGADLCQTVWAAKNSGLRYVMIGTKLNDADTDYIIRDSGAKLLVTESDLSERLNVSSLTASAIRLMLVDGEKPGFEHLYTLAEGQPYTPLAERKRGSSMLYSSGTTGRPKGVMAVLADVPPEEPPARHRQLVENYKFDADTVFITAAPMYHAGPLRLSMAVQRAGGTVVTFQKFDAEAMLAAIAQHRATHGFFVPTMFQRMLDLPGAVRSQYDVTSMRHALHGAAPCPPPVKRAMIEWWGPVIDELYGGTESIGQLYISSEEWLSHPGSVGRPAGLVELKIVDADGDRLASGQTGRIMMRNPQRFAYHGAAASGAGEAYDGEGFASLGDIGYVDEDGYLYLTDRESNMIISGGVNVYPQEAEIVLMGHPAVADVAVIGIAHRELGEEAKALVLLRSSAVASAKLATDIFDYCRKHLSLYKCPRSLDFVTSLPRNDLGKLVKHQIEESFRASSGHYRS